MTRMTAMTMRIWTQLPVFGKLELIFEPKNPSSQSITNTTTIVHNMRFLLMNDLRKIYFDANWSGDHLAVILKV